MFKIIDIHFHVMYSSYPICQSFSRDFFRICLQLPSLPGNVAVYNISLYLTDMKNDGMAWLGDGGRITNIDPKIRKGKDIYNATVYTGCSFCLRAIAFFGALSNNNVEMQYI